MNEKYICIHGHFYQPPRENPWFEEVEFQESAYPYHDWNARITAECYAPNSASRIMDPEWRIIGIVNNYSKISFNFGPTLLYWISNHEPQLYQSILEADKESAKIFSGHGSAIAQVYNHMIMPLANKRDKETQVKWGIKDFEMRFGRYPEGIWLPETAVDIETLETLAENNIKFTILAPHQAKRFRKNGDNEWVDVKDSRIDPRRAYICKLPSKKTISLFFFDKSRASDVAFGNLLSSGDVFANRLMEGFNDSDDKTNPLVHLASDGETYGHHHPHGDMTLAYCIYLIESKKLAKLTNYSEFLENHPPDFEVEIQENTSWSCYHGVERWRNDCGDNSGKSGWKQKWRKPLREAMDWLRDALSSKFEIEAKKYLIDPWKARDNYITIVLDKSRENVERFLLENQNKVLNEGEKQLVLKLLEMQRHSMLMFTSCGWFFDEVSGLETVQVMMYAARAMQLAKQVLGLELENEYVKMLENAPSNIPQFENGAKIYNIFVKQAIVDLSKLGAQGIILQLFSNEKPPTPSEEQQYGCCFTINYKEIEKHEAGKFKLVIAQSTVQSKITLEEIAIAGVAIWLGDQNVSCGIKLDTNDDFFKAIKNEFLEKFNKGEINEIILLIQKTFENNTYSLKDLIKDDKVRILNYIIQDAVKKAIELNEIIYKENTALLRFIKEAKLSPPKSFQTATEIVLNSQIQKLLAAENSDVELISKIISESKMVSIEFDSELISLEASKKITKEFKKILDSPPDANKLEDIEKLIIALGDLPLKLNLWNAQNIAFEIAQKIYKTMQVKNDEKSKTWGSAYQRLCKSIGISLD
jgi:alpha-amylase/alpha-mannosidase (GH57 family)